MKPSFYKSIFTFVLLCSLSGFTFAQNDRERGIELYKQGDYKEAAKFLELARKNNSQDFDAAFFLGMAFLAQNRLKQAQDAFGHASFINPKHAKTLTALSFVLLSRGNYKRAIAEAEKALSLDNSDAETHYVVGAGKAALGDLAPALEHADQAARLNPNLPRAHLLKSQILIRMIGGGKSVKIEEFSKKYGSIGENFLKYVSLVKDKANITDEQKESFDFFIKYYEQNRKEPDSKDDKAVKNEKPLKLLKRPKPAYTDEARNAQVSGTITVLVAFTETGKTIHAFVLNGLGHGLDQEAVKAAKGIKFEPREINGKPVPTVKMIQYSFSVY